MASATPTATVSATPWVTAISSGATAATATIRRAAPSERARPPEGEAARRDRQPRLVEAVDLDVLDLVDAGDEDVHAQAGEQGPQQVDGARGAVQRGGNHVEPDDRQ